MDSKRCPNCGEVKESSEYGRNQSLGDGLSFYCLACNRAKSNAHYRKRRAALGKFVRDVSWVPDGFRWCPSCERAVPHEDYVRNRATASGFGSRCKACNSVSNSESYFYRRYKLTKRQIAHIRAAQHDRCAICGEESPQHLDHDHSTGRTRQLLCQRCNQGLGLMRDDPAILRAAADYVEEHMRRQQRPQPMRVGSAQVSSHAVTRRDRLRVWHVRHQDLLADRSWADLEGLLRDA